MPTRGEMVNTSTRAEQTRNRHRWPADMRRREEELLSAFCAPIEAAFDAAIARLDGRRTPPARTIIEGKLYGEWYVAPAGFRDGTFPGRGRATPGITAFQAGYARRSGRVS